MPPISDVVIREVARGVWTFSRPFARFGLLPVGGRSTAVQLNDGGAWVLASTPLTEDTKSKLDELGGARYLIGPDVVHHIFLSEYRKAYPEAKLLGVAELVNKQKDLTFDGALIVWGRDPPGTKYGFEDEIFSCHFTGFKNKDVAFYHPATKVMITADLIFNLPATEQYSKSKSSGKIPVSMGPTGWIHSRLISSLGMDQEAMRRDAQTVAAWDIEKIIMCHGDVIETDGDKAWKAAYKAYL